MTLQEANEVTARIAAQLGEHFEAVQLVVSWTDANGTNCITQGCGNWYARVGMAKALVDADEARTAAREIKNILPPPDNSDESWKNG